jgi:hypothetical protein
MASPLAMALLQAQAGSGQPSPVPAQVAPTNYTQATSDYNTAMEQAYQAKLQQQNAFWGGLAGLGSAGVLASASSAGPLAKLFGHAATTATPAATTVAGAPASNALDNLMLNGGVTGAPVSLAAPDTVAAADAAAGTGAAADAGTAAAAGGGTDLLSALAALFAF